MIGEKRVLGLIPARGGSKGLPGKNIRPICGKPLIVWSIEQALSSAYIDEVLVSTDSEEIAEIAKNAGASVPFIRPDHLAADTSPTLVVADHALEFYETTKGQRFDYLILLEPTSPLREKDDIDRMLVKLDSAEEEYDSIVSVGVVGEHPSIMMRLVGERVEPFYSGVETASRRQDNEPAYFPYGVAYIVKTETFRQERKFFTDRCTSYQIKRYQNYEIDDIYDFLAIENIMRYEWSIK